MTLGHREKAGTTRTGRARVPTILMHRGTAGTIPMRRVTVEANRSRLTSRLPGLAGR